MASLFTAALLTLVASSAAGASSPASTDSTRGEGRYIVVLKDSEPDPAAVAREHSRRHGAEVSHVYSSALKGYAAKVDDGRVGEVRSDPRVAFVEPDREVRALGTADVEPGEVVPTGVRRVEAATTTLAHDDASGVGIAVIDTGIDLTHPDLDSAVSGINCLTPDLEAQDDHGHGTHVAGTIAAENDGAGVIGAGVVGVAPGTRLYAVKVLNAAGVGFTSDVVCGIEWVTATRKDVDPLNDIEVANMSLGGDGRNDNNCGNTNKDSEHIAICNSTAAGVTYVVAAGNDGTNFSGTVPAAYPEVLTVTAMSDSDGEPRDLDLDPPSCRPSEKDDSYATFSNYAVAPTEISHTIAGPGVCIESSYLGSLTQTLSGTSMAAPHVAGTVALCLDGPCAGLAPSKVIEKVRADAQAHATNSNGFTGDPLNPVTTGSKRKKVTRYYGYLDWAGGY